MNARPPLRVLIVDDEFLARQRIEDLLAHERGVEVVGQADNGPAAVAAIRDLRPDLVFLDVQMPGMTGVEVLRRVGPEAMPAVVFVTAYDRYALEAFELTAVDYLVKPFDDERFEQAFRRARRMVELEQVDRTTRRLLALLHPDEPADAEPGRAQPARRASDYLERIPVHMTGQVRVVPVQAIDYITADGPYAELHVGGKKYVVRERMQTLEDRLDPSRFFRVHRSAIVRLDTIEALLRGSGGDCAVRLRDGTELSVSRGRRDELARWLGVAGPRDDGNP